MGAGIQAEMSHTIRIGREHHLAVQGPVQSNRVAVAHVKNILMCNRRVLGYRLAERCWRTHHYGQKCECERQYCASRTVKHCFLREISRFLPQAGAALNHS
jgi:hypothetical protein